MIVDKKEKISAKKKLFCLSVSILCSGGIINMSGLTIDLMWQRQESKLLPSEYSTEHSIKYNDLYELQADTAPDWGGNPLNTNPEQALTSAVSSCHMMTFLALAAKVKWPVSSFKDRAEAYLDKGPNGRMCISMIELNPIVEFDSGFEITEDEIEDMHDRAHRYCFVANSLAEHVKIKIN